jgi:hypothetical protein
MSQAVSPGVPEAANALWLGVEGGIQYTYFVQHEKSREDDTLVQLSDVAFMLGVTHRC